MTLVIDYKHKNEKSDIVKLAQLINEEYTLANFVGELYIMGEAYRDDNTLTKEDMSKRVQEDIESEFKINPIFKYLDKYKADFFKKQWIKLYNSGKLLSELFEEMIRLKGPLSCVIEPLGYSREGLIHSCESRKNSFDVTFFENHKYKPRDLGGKIAIDRIVEFHECKLNACNFFPLSVNGKVRRETRNKLAFIDDVKNHLERHNFIYRIYMPTLHEEVQSAQDYLISNGYDYVEVISYSDMIV